MKDEDVDTSDIPPLGKDFSARAKLRLPKKKVAVTLNVDEEVLEWFKSQGEDYEVRLNAALWIYARAHQQHHR
jgi:uncharacterized protein (DUF4415 family)